MSNKKLYNIHIYNTLCSNRTYDILFKEHGVTSGNAAQYFYYLLATGLAEQKNVTVKVNSLLPVNSKDQKKVFWKSENNIENNIWFKSIPIINIILLRNILVNIYVFFQILFTRFPKNKENIILTDFLKLTLNLSVILASKIRGVKTITVITDMPGEGVTQATFLGRVRDKINIYLTYDFYVCVTKQLNKQLNRKNKPAVIIESFANICLKDVPNLFENKFSERVLVYAGSLYERYGLKTLIEAFIQIPDADLRLYFYGIGPFKEEIDKFAKLDPRVKYKGVVNHSEMMQVLIRSTLLINPRPSHEVFTRYSYPSKNLEYMSTGTPLLTTKLQGIPADHEQYIFVIEEESIQGVKKAIQKILKMDLNDIHAFGLRSKNFVLLKKNNIKQASKIISILN